jgi:hypothetical protein
MPESRQFSMHFGYSLTSRDTPNIAFRYSKPKGRTAFAPHMK